MIDISRHKELFNPETFFHPVTIIGAGATGSWLAIALAKLGIENITVYDFDIVEEHNIANQAYSILGCNFDAQPLDLLYTPKFGDIGKSKVFALEEHIFISTGTTITVHNEPFTNQRLSGIVFLMVDSMKTRKEIWEASIKMKTSVVHLIEPRMGLDVGRIYNVSPCNLEHIKQYENTYYNDDVAEVSACGNSMTVISSALGIASWCVRQLINFHNNIELDNEILIDFKYNNVFTTKW